MSSIFDQPSAKTILLSEPKSLSKAFRIYRVAPSSDNLSLNFRVSSTNRRLLSVCKLPKYCKLRTNAKSCYQSSCDGKDLRKLKRLKPLNLRLQMSQTEVISIVQDQGINIFQEEILLSNARSQFKIPFQVQILKLLRVYSTTLTFIEFSKPAVVPLDPVVKTTVLSKGFRPNIKFLSSCKLKELTLIQRMHTGPFPKMINPKKYGIRCADVERTCGHFGWFRFHRPEFDLVMCRRPLQASFKVHSSPARSQRKTSAFVDCMMNRVFEKSYHSWVFRNVRKPVNFEGEFINPKHSSKIVAEFICRDRNIVIAKKVNGHHKISEKKGLKAKDKQAIEVCKAQKAKRLQKSLLC
jgi:hypothetical protein